MENLQPPPWLPHVPDRGALPTEQRMAASGALDALGVEQTLRLINTQDATVPAVVRQAIPAITRLVESIVEGMQRGGLLVYVGAGTSGRLGVLDASECPPTFHSDPGQVVGLIAGGDRALRHSVEGAEDDPAGAHQELIELDIGADDTVVGIAAGGTTPYVWGALELAHQRGAVTGLVTCVKLSRLAPRPRAPLVAGNQPVALPEAPPPLQVPVDHVVELVVGPEVVTGSTRMKAGTATKLALNMISTATMVQLGKVWGNLMVDLRASNAKLRDRAARILMTQCHLPRGEAEALLSAAQGRVKVALVMAKRGVSCEQALVLLDQHGQRLRPIIGEPR